MDKNADGRITEKEVGEVYHMVGIVLNYVYPKE